MSNLEQRLTDEYGDMYVAILSKKLQLSNHEIITQTKFPSEMEGHVKARLSSLLGMYRYQFEKEYCHASKDAK